MAAVDPMKESEKSSKHSEKDFCGLKRLRKGNALLEIQGFIEDITELLSSLEELLQDCYRDRAALLQIFKESKTESFKSIQLLLNCRLEAWKITNNHKTQDQRIIALISGGKVMLFLKFLLIMNKNHKKLLKFGSRDFDELLTLYKIVKEFQTTLKTCDIKNSRHRYFYSEEIDQLLSLFYENQDEIHISDDILHIYIFEDKEDDDDDENLLIDIQAIELKLSKFIENLASDLVDFMMELIDEKARIKGYLWDAENPVFCFDGGKELLNIYRLDPVLNACLESITQIDPTVDLLLAIKDARNVFLSTVMDIKEVDGTLASNNIKRISYLDQSYDPTNMFSVGQCFGDSKLWCFKMNEKKHKPSIELRKNFFSMADVHEENVTIEATTFQAQQLFKDEEIKSIQLEKDKICFESFFESLYILAKRNVNVRPVSFSVSLSSNTTKDHHRISFCCFEENDNKSLWRFRNLDAGMGEFESAFKDLKKWFISFIYPNFFKKYEYDELKISIMVRAPLRIEKSSDESYREQIELRFNYLFSHSLYLDKMSQNLLTLSEKITSPTEDDFLMCAKLFLLNSIKFFSSNQKLSLECSEKGCQFLDNLLYSSFEKSIIFMMTHIYLEILKIQLLYQLSLEAYLKEIPKVKVLLGQLMEGDNWSQIKYLHFENIKKFFKKPPEVSEEYIESIHEYLENSWKKMCEEIESFTQFLKEADNFLEKKFVKKWWALRSIFEDIAFTLWDSRKIIEDQAKFMYAGDSIWPEELQAGFEVFSKSVLDGCLGLNNLNDMKCVVPLFRTYSIPTMLLSREDLVFNWMRKLYEEKCRERNKEENKMALVVYSPQPAYITKN